MYGYIYLTTNLINDKIYIGQHHSNKFDESYKGSGKLIKKAFQKYGFENFSCVILEWCNTPEELDQREIYYIKKYCTEPNGHYNIAAGGNGGDLRKYLSQEEVEHWKKAIGDANRGKTRTQEFKDNVSKTQKGHITSEETRNKISLANTGHSVSTESREKMRNAKLNSTPWNKGLKGVQESPRKGVKLSEEQKQAQREKILGRKAVIKAGKRKVIQPELIQQYLDDGWELLVKNN